MGHAFDSLAVLRGVTLEVERGEFVAIVGPSGCGKTTLLGIIAGVLQPTEGSIARVGQVRTVHQVSGLLPWRTVSQNIELGVDRRSTSAEANGQLQEMLRLVGLEAFAGYYPHQLSGGMRQRAELARALAGHVDILLLDEPFSSLDYLTRLRMREEFVGLLHERPRTVILVTHDVSEAVQLADRVLVLSGRPGGIRCELQVESPRPRELTQPEVVRATHRILTELGLEHDAAGNSPYEI
ncbi:MAG: ABC transporter ATP-binding protein [Planctomycetota bacterium]